MTTILDEPVAPSKEEMAWKRCDWIPFEDGRARASQMWRPILFLVGHERAAFGGQAARRIGRFEMADCGAQNDLNVRPVVITR